MKRALISDIHGNDEALNAVLSDIGAQGISEIYCLGDIVGYGPNPCECLDKIIRKAKATILGNHDQAALFDPDGFNPVALQAVYWTRDQLDSRGGVRQINERWDFLGELPRMRAEGDYLFVHGSPRDPTNEYVFPEDVYNQRKMEALFERVTKYCFQGHTHIPGVFTSTNEFISPEECDYVYSLTDAKVMVNVGSVGQPRDNDPRACYVILDTEANSVTFRRVEYGIDATADKIYGIPALDNMLGDRLKTGR
ncbi:MAG TPA: phosphoesterase [Planctomycetaceae bacterium]|nr:phosphoesterase [Blastopirellula sp.]HAY80511.1 phosphoesterase [Planctomycetaceae bacterium]